MKRRHPVLEAIALALGLSAPAHAQLQPDVLQLYGGLYAVDCARPESPRLRVERDALHVEQGNSRLSARQDLVAIHAYFGQSAPPDFLVALDAQVGPQMNLTFLVYRDRRGQYARLDGHPTVLAKLGALAQSPFRACSATVNEREADLARQEQEARRVARTPQPASRATHPSELVRDRDFMAAWRRALGPLSREAWLARLDGPAPEITHETLAGQRWLVAAFCKPHDCGDHNAVLIYDAATPQVHGLVHRAGAATLVGQPAPALVPELQRLWRHQWRPSR